MFRDCVLYYFTVLGNRVKLNLFCIFKELRNNHRIFFRNFGSHLQEILQFLVIIANIHCSSRKHVRRTNQYRIAYFFYESFDILKARQLLPSRLVDTQLIKHSGEFVTILGAVDRDWRSTQYRNRLTVKFHGQVVRDLSTYGNNHTTRLFKIDYVKHTFKRKFVEVQTVAHIIVCRNCFRVVVNHN